MTADAAPLRGHLLALAALHLLFHVLYYTPRLREDAPYYYEPLRSAFFDGDVNYHNERPFTRRFGPVAGRRQFVKGPNEAGRPLTGGPNNTFDVGTTVLQIPFFLAGHAATRAAAAAGLDIPTHGYGRPYELAMGAGFLLAGLLGSYLLYGAALFHADPWASFWGTALATWGSFMPAYLYEDTLLSHLPSYVAASLVLFLLGHAARRPAPWIWLAVGAAFSWLVMARRQNGLMVVLLGVLAPVLVSSWRAGRRRAALLLAALAAGGFAFVLPELVLWKIQYGSFVANPGMVPLRARPVLGLVLLSDHGGLFSHSPVLIPGALGLLLLVARAPWWGVALCLGVLGQVTINALRVEWWPGIGYGNRRSDSIVPLLAVGLAVALSRLPRHPRRATLAALAVLFLWNMASLPQFYASDNINEKGSHFATYAGQRSPGRATVRWPFVPLRRLPALLAEDARIVLRQSYTLRGGTGGLAMLAVVASSSLGLFLAATRWRPGAGAGRAASLAAVGLLGLAPAAFLAAAHVRTRSVVALYYDPGEPVERLVVGPQGFTGGVTPVVIPPGQARTFEMPPAATAALELVVRPTPGARACVLTDQGSHLEAGAEEGRPLPHEFPGPGRHHRLALPEGARPSRVTVSACGTEPLELYGLAAAAP